jgi:2-aminoethylphosphonate-pyruvate transaminase
MSVTISSTLASVVGAGAEHVVVPVAAGGAAAVEAAVIAAVPHGKALAVVDNGALGERLDAIARAHGITVVHVRYAWGDLAKAADVAAALVADGDIAAVVVAHHESAVGLLNPVAAIGAVCRAHGALLVVDATASLGREDLSVTRDRIDLLAGALPIGDDGDDEIGVLCASATARERLAAVRPRSVALDARAMLDGRAGRVPAARAAAFAAACERAAAAADPGARLAARRRTLAVREALARLGYLPLTRSGAESSSVVVCSIPDGVAAEQLFRMRSPATACSPAASSASTSRSSATPTSTR